MQNLYDVIIIGAGAAGLMAGVFAARNGADVTILERNEKADAMARLLEMGDYAHVIAFCNTKNMTDRLVGLLQMRGISAQGIHGDIAQSAREKTLKKFRDGQIRVLVATDIAARGLDIQELSHVFNYNLSEVPETYIHRIGRTGRAKNQGEAYNLLSSVTEEIRLDQIARNNQYDIPTITI